MTENSHLRTKLRIRKQAVELIGKDSVNVLDAYAGEGVVWNRMRREMPDVKFTTLGIEKRKYLSPSVIMGDNRKVMKGLDLTQFDLIDLDAFGCPWEQLTIAAQRAPHVPVVLTHISVTLGPVPKGLLKAAGLPSAWYESMGIPQALFGRMRWHWWEVFCSGLGYTTSVSELHLDKSAIKLYEYLYRD